MCLRKQASHLICIIKEALKKKPETVVDLATIIFYHRNFTIDWKKTYHLYLPEDFHEIGEFFLRGLKIKMNNYNFVSSIDYVNLASASSRFHCKQTATLLADLADGAFRHLSHNATLRT